MSKTIIATAEAPAAIGPYSQAIRTGNTLYISGQIGLTPGEGGDFAGADVESQTRQVLNNMQAIVTEAGGTMKNIVSTTVLLTDMNDYATVNGVYATFFPSDPPARAAYAVTGLPKGALVEIACKFSFKINFD